MESISGALRRRLGSFGIAAALALLSMFGLAASAAAGGLVISQVYGGGGNSGATYKNDFVELFNPTTSAISVNGWSVQYNSATGIAAWQVTNLTGTIQPGQYFLIQEAAGTGGTANLPTPDVIGSINMSATTGRVALVSSTTAIPANTSCPLVGNVDFFGYGPTALCFEGAAAALLTNTTAALRKSSGCTDSNNNASDFDVSGAPAPRNSASPIHCCGVSLSETHVNVSCNGASDGSVDLTVSGAIAPVTYSWTNGASSEDLSGLAAGSYTVTATDAGGCTATTTVTITEPPTLVASASGAILCHGGTAHVVVAATGGTPPYSGTGMFDESAGSFSYKVTDANGCSSTASITLTDPSLLEASASAGTIACFGGTTNVAVSATGGTPPYSGTGTFSANAGSHDYTVTDASGCTSTASVTLTEPTQLVASASAGTIDCFGGSTTLTISATGGTPPYTGTGTQTVSAGTYNSTVTDANGCTSTASVTITQPTELVASASGRILCHGDHGDITVSATGGTPPYAGTGTFNEVAGTYSYKVTDANGCSSTASITLTEPALLEASATASPILCHNGRTDVTVTATGGTPPYTGTGTFSETAGFHPYTITDANGCTASASITLTEPPLLDASFTAGTIACFGGSTNVVISATGGTPPYTGTGTFSLSAGRHDYTVTDANGCETLLKITLTQPTELVASAVAGTIDCFGGSTTLTISATGGTPPYTGTGTQTVSAGTYSATVTDANGCTASASVTITQPTELVASASGRILCHGDHGNVTVSATGGTPPYAGTGTFSEVAGTYSYKVTDANGCSSTASITLTDPALLEASTSAARIACFGGSADVDVKAQGGTPPYTGTGTFTVVAGTYSYTVTDANGCTATTSITLTQPTELVASATAGTIACFGGSTTLTISATGGTPPYTGTGTQTVSAGSYTATVTDANGCTSSATVTITQPTQLEASATAGTILCHGGSTNVTVSATGGTPPYTGTGTFSAAAGAHSYTVTDANGCTSIASVNLTEPAALALSETHVNAVCGTGGSIDLTVTGGTAPYTYLWSNAATTEDLSGVGPGSYSVTVTDANGCTANTSVTITNTVTPSATSLSSNHNPAKFSTAVAITAQVTPAGVTGTVTIYDGTLSVGSGAIDGGGMFTLSLTTLAVGTHSLTAVYSGDACYESSTSPVLSQVIVQDDPPSVTVTSPNGGEIANVSSDFNITWTATDDIGVASVSIYVSRDNGTTWELIVADIPNSGTYDWFVTAPFANTSATPVFSARIRVDAKDTSGQIGTDASDSPFAIFGNWLLGVGGMPHEFSFSAAWPNPATGAMHVNMALPKETEVHVSVVDLQGRQVALLAHGAMQPGRYQLDWNGHTSSGTASAGVYFVRYVAADQKLYRRFVLTH